MSEIDKEADAAAKAYYQKDRVQTLARDMCIAFISVGQIPADGEYMRQFVRHAREFYSEVDSPTVPRRKAPPVEEEQPAELLLED